METLNILGIIQARVGSTRLPGKVLFALNKEPVILHVYKRVHAARLIDEIIVATSLEKNNLPLVRICTESDIRVFCGSENDVLDRFYQVSNILRPKQIVRITADCPLIDPDIIDKVIRFHLDNSNDYTSNTVVETYPDGLDVEIFTMESLSNTWENALLPSEREHVTPFLRNPKNGFKIGSVINRENLSGKRWTLDTEEDYVFIKSVFEHLYPNNNEFRMSDILSFLAKHKELELLNSKISRNEGYKKSFEQDKLQKKHL